MNLKIKVTPDKLTCEFCKNPFYPAPQVKCPKTCGRPECLNGLRRLYKATRKISAFLLSDYHRVLDTLDSKGMRDYWYLIYVMGETGLLVSEVIRIRPADFKFDGPDKTIHVRRFFQASNRRGAYHRISGTVAGNLERLVAENGTPKGEPVFPFTKRGVQKIFQRALDLAGIPGKWGTRSLRHMYGLTVALATDSISAVRRAMRTKGTRSASIYVKTARDIMKGD